MIKKKRFRDINIIEDTIQFGGEFYDIKAIRLTNSEKPDLNIYFVKNKDTIATITIPYEDLSKNETIIQTGVDKVRTIIYSRNDASLIVANKIKETNANPFTGCTYTFTNNLEESGEELIKATARKGEDTVSYLERQYATKVQKEEKNNVNHPSHYTWLKELCGIEVLDITRHLDFNTGNAIKYLLRAGKKDPKKTIEDLQKAIFYINDKIESLKNGNN